MQPGSVVGVDAGKRSMEVVRVFRDKPEIQRGRFQTDARGRDLFKRWLKREDMVLIEAGTGTFFLAKEIVRDVGCEVIPLNPGKLAMIYKSLKKTDREDALNLARLGLRNPKEELPVVPVPTDEEEECRKILSEHTFYSEERTRLINRLHSVYYQKGHTGLTKKDIKTRVNREEKFKLLSGRSAEEAGRLMKKIDYLEEDLKTIQNSMKESLGNKLEILSIYMSMTGIGLINSMAIFSHMGNFERFSHAGQASNFAGLTPRVDQSGDTLRMGKTSRQCCRAVKRVLVQGAWSLVCSKKGGEIKEMFERIRVRRGKRIAIIAVARKMIEVLYSMVKNHTYYRGVTQEVVDRKLKYYGLLKISGQGA